MFSPKETKIYRWVENGRKRAIDPAKVESRLGRMDNFDLPTDYKLMKMGASGLKPGTNEEELSELAKKKIAESYAAWDRIIAATRMAFNIKEYSEDEDGNAVGLTDAQCFELLNDFYGWQVELKKNTPGSPPTANSTEESSLPLEVSQ
jgi:hypothetical protein